MRGWGVGRVAAVGVIAVLAAGALVMSSAQPSLADPAGRNGAAAYAINVPSSVLTAAGSNGLIAARLANGQAFDWDLADPKFTAVGGTFTATPADPAVALSTADAASFTAATDTFVVPVVPAGTLTKVLGTTSVALSGFSLGVMVGSAGARVFGFKDDMVCREGNSGLTVMASLLDGVDCSAYQNTLDALLRNADQPTTYLPKDICGLGACATFLGTTIARDGSYGGWKFACAAAGAGLTTSYALLTAWSDGSRSAANGYGSYDCGRAGYTGNLIGSIPQSRFTDPTVTSFQVAQYVRLASGYYEWQYGPQSPITATDFTRPNPTRNWVCAITDTTGQRYSTTSAAFTEADPTQAPLECPSLPAGKTAARITITEVTAGQSATLRDTDSTGAYRAWAATFPECRNGSCLLDLRQNGSSCFAATTNCVNWATDPSRDSIYSCYYGTHQLPLTECYIYGVLFASSSWPDGHAYANPQDGTDVGQTAPTLEDTIVSHIIQKKRVRGDGDLATDAHTVARQCIALNIANQCKQDDMPIFAPGGDVRAATHHDLIAITGVPGPNDVTNGLGPRPPILTYTDTPTAPSRWYTAYSPCDSGYDGTVVNCDEYPYRSTEEGGKDAGGNAQASLQLIDPVANQLEGSWLGAFYGLCNVNSSSPKFAVVPVDVDPTVFRTSAWCPKS